jgi:putative addiction module CopG family antidote
VEEDISMTTRVPADVEAGIRQLIEGGRFGDADTVMREALRLLQAHDRKMQGLRAELQIGLDQEARDELIDWTPDLMEELKQEPIAARDKLRSTSSTTE